MKPRKAKVPFIIGAVATIAAVILFMIGRNQNPYFLWGGLAAAILAAIFLLAALTRFLRNRSITSGLFISTTAVTITYFVGSRFVNSALPMTFTNAAVNTADATLTTTTNNGFFAPLIFAQIGLFALWFLLILFIIYVYVRPIKKIDFLLSQIIEAKEIKKMRLGKGRQYQNIANKLQVIADEKHQIEMKKQAQRARARARANVKRDLVAKIVKEKSKIPSPNANE